MRRYLALALLLAAALFAGWQQWISQAAPASSEPFFVEYPIPYSGGAPGHLVTVAPGELYFTMPLTDSIGQLQVTSADSFTFTQLPLPTGSAPYDIAYDGSYLWATLPGTNQLAQISTTVGVSATFYAISSSASFPSGVTVAPNKDIWFTLRDANAVAFLERDSGVIQEFPYTRPGALPEDIAVERDTDNDNPSIWFTAPGVNRVVNFDPSLWPSSGAFLGLLACPPFPLPCDDPAPNQIVMGGKQSWRRPWVTVPGLQRLGRYDASTFGNWQWYLAEDAQGLAGIDATTSANSNVTRVWFVASGSNQAGYVDVNASGSSLGLLRNTLPTAGSLPLDIDVDSAGHGWISASGSAQIVAWRPPYFQRMYLPYVHQP